MADIPINNLFQLQKENSRLFICPRFKFQIIGESETQPRVAGGVCEGRREESRVAGSNRRLETFVYRKFGQEHRRDKNS